MGQGLARQYGGATSSAVATVLRKTLSSSTTNVTASAPTSTGQLLIVEVTQSSAGGDQITWDTSASKFEAATPVDINPAGSSITRFLFVAIAGNWCFLSITLV